MARSVVSKLVLAVLVVATLALEGCCCCHEGEPPAGTSPAITGGYRVIGAFDPPVNKQGDGSTNSTATASGLFNVPNHICKYDLSVTYNRKLTTIEVYAAPASVPAASFPGTGDTYLVKREGFDPLGTTATGHGTWYGDDLPGTYDGSTEYQMLIRVTYNDSQFGLDELTVHFTNITSSTWETVP